MNRNVESHFALNPTKVDISRSTFDRSHTVKTSFNVGDLIPFYVDEVLPGDTFNVKTSKVVRLQTLITPMMDNIYLDTYFFFVPNRLVWEHWKQFNGENTESAWLPETTYQVPVLISTPVPGEEQSGPGWEIGTIADYMGIPTGVVNLNVNALPFRAYALICNEWFRDENLSDPLLIPTGDASSLCSNGSNYITDVARGGKPFKVAKYSDYFTSCLPAPQKGPDVTIALADGAVPVYGNGKALGLWTGATGSGQVGTLFNDAQAGAMYSNTPFNQQLPFVGNTTGVGAGALGVVTREKAQSVGGPTSTGLEMYLDGVSVATVNQLRMAFQIQKLFERDARGGSRYTEIIKSHFGITSPDARQQRPEYLGGNRIPIRVSQVIQQSGTSEGTTPQGNVAGMSLTTDTHSDFTKSFTEHGFVIGVMCARYDHTYQQGLERMWSRRSRFDYYWPALANIGEQAVLNKEIYAQGPGAYPEGEPTNPYDEQVFGYQEAWADYRYKPSHVTGEMRSQAHNSLDSWHLADDYNALPSLSDSWIREDKSNVDRVLAVSSQVSNQLFADIYIKNRTTRPMPIYSIPGLIDHH